MPVTLLVEKYRPQTMDDYVWRDAAQREKAEEWIKEGALPHMLLSGLSGTGKTSLAELLLRQIGIPAGDILKINASRERLADVVQDKITSFVSTWALGPSGIKYILLDEADSMSPLAQRMLRGVMEEYHDICRFILTANYAERIIPAIHGRCQGFQFSALDKDDYTARAGQILVEEGIEFDVDVLLEFVNISYPDLRKCINLIQQNTRQGTLFVPSEKETDTKDYLFEMANLFKSQRYLEARKLIVSQAQLEEYPDIYKFLYRNLELWGNSQDDQDEALLIIKRGLVDHAVICDAELNLSATIVELSRIKQGK